MCNWIHTIWRLIIDVASIDIGEVWRWSTILIVLGIRGIYSVLRLLWRGRLLHTLINLREFWGSRLKSLAHFLKHLGTVSFDSQWLSSSDPLSCTCRRHRVGRNRCGHAIIWLCHQYYINYISLWIKNYIWASYKLTLTIHRRRLYITPTVNSLLTDNVISNWIIVSAD